MRAICSQPMSYPGSAEQPAVDARKSTQTVSGDVDGLQPLAAEPTVAPVGPSIAALLDEAQAFLAMAVAEPTTAPVGPSISASLGQTQASQAVHGRPFRIQSPRRDR